MSKLAITGGPPAIPQGKRLAPYPEIGAAERQRIDRVLASGKLWAPWAPMTRELEETWAAYVGTVHCRAVSSGTAALHCALVGCGVGPGDEVLVPAYSYLASAATVFLTGACPVFVDVRADGNLDPEKASLAITGRTKAIIAVHLHGAVADMSAIMELAKKYSILVIEDCAQAHGAVIDGRRVGNASKIRNGSK